MLGVRRLYFPGLGEGSREGQGDSGSIDKRVGRRGWTVSLLLWKGEGSLGIAGLSMVHTSLSRVNVLKGKPVHLPFTGFLSLLV